MRPFACPVCNGAGTVSRPPWVPGDQQTWVGNSTGGYHCNACNGSGLLWKAVALAKDDGRLA